MQAIRGMMSVAVLGVCLSVGTVLGAEPKTDVEKSGRIPVFRLHGLLPEAPPAFDFGFQMEPRRSLYELVKRLGQAKKDDDVKAVVLIFDQPMLGWAQMQELRQAMSDLRAADKDVYCYLEEACAGTYLLASAGSRIVIVPTGEIHLTGLHAEHVYLKGLLDKIKVEADIEQMGAYKGAAEPFTRTGPTEEAKEMIEWLVGDLFDQMVEMVADGRQIPADQVRELIDRGPFTAAEALAAKLVDETAYAETLVPTLKKRYGEDVEFVHNYGAKELPEVDFSSPFAIFTLIGKAMAKGKAPAKPSVAIVYIDGVIMTGKTEQDLFGENAGAGSTTLRRILRQAADDETIKAVVLRVDSPGGSAVASDIIWHAAAELGETKPLVVSMGNVAASGGYYVSAGAGTIFAEPGSITGSIGVFGGKLVTKGLWDWLGVTFYETTLGKNADLYSSNRRFDDRQRALIRKHMQIVYDEFKDRVSKGRGDRLKKDLEQLAGGRVFTGRQAQASGLVDKLGGLQDAIKFAAGEANVSDYEVRLLPEPESFMDLFMRGLTGQEKEDDESDVEVTAGPRLWTLKEPAIRELLETLQRLDPQRARAVLRSVLRIELLSHEHALLVMPGEVVVK